MSKNAVMLRRMTELESRVQALEKRLTMAQRDVRLLDKYGETVNKTCAAEILGVTRVTVYAMLEDGRIAPACGGKRVDTCSIAQYLSTPHDTKRGPRPEGDRSCKCPVNGNAV